jgi:CRISPR-associated endonuclease Cas3-HD
MEQSSDLCKHAGRQARLCSLTGTGHEPQLRRTHEHGCAVMHSGVSSNGPTFWAKTVRNAQGEEVPGLSVLDHCRNVGCVAEALIAALPSAVRALLPVGAATLAALHDVGKITPGFQAKCSRWLGQDGLPKFATAELVLSVTDHALVSQYFLQNNLLPGAARPWAVAVGAHHGRPKGRSARIPSGSPEAWPDWASAHRARLAADLLALFGELPSSSPDPCFDQHYSDLWLLAGLITVADWIGSNETWFPPDHGLSTAAARRQAHRALAHIGWPGGTLQATGFSEAFAPGHHVCFEPNSLQTAAAELGRTAGTLIIEGPMGGGKTEAALFVAQQLIATGPNHGIYFALPTQVTSNRIHQRLERFLSRTLAGEAPLRLAHGNAWLEDDFDLRLRPAFGGQIQKGEDSPAASVREARSWFSSAKQALLATYGVGTIDQALQGVVAVSSLSGTPDRRTGRCAPAGPGPQRPRLCALRPPPDPGSLANAERNQPARRYSPPARSHLRRTGAGRTGGVAAVARRAGEDEARTRLERRGRHPPARQSDARRQGGSPHPPEGPAHDASCAAPLHHRWPCGPHDPRCTRRHAPRHQRA